MSTPQKIYIEASSLTERRTSGIGHMTVETIRALERHPECGIKFKIVLVSAYDKIENLKVWKFKNVEYKKILLPMRIFNVIWKYDLLPPMDIFIGKGVYIFPNYKNWRLLNSINLTYICDISYLLFPEFVSPKNQKFLAKNVNKWTKRSDKIFTISNNSAKEISENIEGTRNKIVVVPCGVDTTVFYRRSNKEVAELMHELNINSDFILYLGNIEPRKNLEGLLEAYKSLPTNVRKNNALLIVGGGGWLNEKILEKIQKMQKEGFNIIKPTEYIPDSKLPALYSGAKILVHPAHYEGFGISPLQAMACETPVVVSNNSSIPEVVGDAGLYFDSKNVVEISDKIYKVLSNIDVQSRLMWDPLESTCRHASLSIL